MHLVSKAMKQPSYDLNASYEWRINQSNQRTKETVFPGSSNPSTADKRHLKISPMNQLLNHVGMKLSVILMNPEIPFQTIRKVAGFFKASPCSVFFLTKHLDNVDLLHLHEPPQLQLLPYKKMEKTIQIACRSRITTSCTSKIFGWCRFYVCF